MFHPSPFARGFYLACSAALGCGTVPLTAHAQLPPLPAAKAASEPSAMERSQRQSDNVYRFIKQFADTPRKLDPAAVRPKTEVVAPAPAPVRRPDPQTIAAPASPQPPPPETAPAATAASTANTESAAPAQAASAAPEAPVAVAAREAVVVEEEDLKVIEQVQPEFPRGMSDSVDSGKVTVAFTVQPNGTVSEASVVSSTHRRLSKPARDAVAQWRFAPIKTARAAQVEIEFNLQ
ncbi:MAG: TonB family protein [Pseudomonadota bacterium]